jgi:hypothetical protein
MSEETRAGRCFCGRVRFVAAGAPKWVAHCHCESCRRATSSPFTTYVGYVERQVRWSSEALATYESSPGVVRRFCRHCGSPMSFSGARWPDEIHLFAASFDDPTDFAPKSHVHAGEQLPWLHLGDGLPRYATTPREGPPLP